MEFLILAAGYLCMLIAGVVVFKVEHRLYKKRRLSDWIAKQFANRQPDSEHIR